MFWKKKDKDKAPERPSVSPEDGKKFVDKFVGEHPSEGEVQMDPTPDTAIANPDLPLDKQIIEQIKTIFDPEIPVNIYDLGLIYDVDVNADKAVMVTMTLTTPHCPVAETMPAEVEARVRQVPDVSDVSINLIWDPPWDPSRMSEEARLELGFM